MFFSAEVRAISHGSYDLASWALQQAEVPMAWARVASAEVVGVEVITGSVVMSGCWMFFLRGLGRLGCLYLVINIPIFQEWYPCI